MSKKIVKQWMERAEYDIDTARGMIRLRKYLYAAFMAQQALEKMLKALLAAQDKSVYPTHNLQKIAADAGIFAACDVFDEGLLAELTPYCIKARYGEYKRKLSELCNRKTALQLVQRTERILIWLEKKIGALS